jgi:antitoxin component of MazEF toxin-antitoxin module
MSVKVRRVGNSFTVTIPAGFVESLNLYDGQELEVSASEQTLEYKPLKALPKTIKWEDYEPISGNLRDGMTPDEYVRSLRDNDR